MNCLSHDINQIQNQQKGSTLFFQRKLSINQPNDVYEQEADAVADKVMRMPDPSINNNSFFKPAITSIQRKCAHCEEEEKKMQRKENNNAEPQTENYLSTVSGGRPLSQTERSFFEPRFGYDFSNVQLHTDTAANESAKSLNALAYTHNNNIVFAPDQYQPGSDEGKKLMAHELTHVVQQTGNIQPYRSSKSFNFGKNDTATLVEDSFNADKDKEKKPWIELITVELDTKTKDVNDIETWTGKGTVKYHDNAFKWPDFSFSATAGSESLGMTSKGTYTVKRIEGIGYNSGKYSGTYDKTNREGPNNRYSKDLSANMSYAVFFNGGEALHAGPLDWSSHGCVHVDWGSIEVIQQINYHSVIGLTKVQVKYP
ncbi:eCIS core domain-containing protein [Parafilimonas terrae]|uniref:Uncharacterized protein n=1 Tax=Parafilimonas terrae TaxID=1465490 RepID=A0A1I5YPT8_9BACT|nr:DUF4157 domain-containing protein [Parafilimonas terrae]SFQ46278.1 protein of unknown function [Parafilimonas terrae]